jgi:hypothetical protein
MVDKWPYLLRDPIDQQMCEDVPGVARDSTYAYTIHQVSLDQCGLSRKPSGNQIRCSSHRVNKRLSHSPEEVGE